jgi:hypothetical protein
MNARKFSSVIVGVIVYVSSTFAQDGRPELRPIDESQPFLAPQQPLGAPNIDLPHADNTIPRNPNNIRPALTPPKLEPSTTIMPSPQLRSGAVAEGVVQLLKQSKGKYATIYTATRSYDGVITAVVPNERFVGLKAYGGEGMVKVADIESVFVRQSRDE